MNYNLKNLPVHERIPLAGGAVAQFLEGVNG